MPSGMGERSELVPPSNKVSALAAEVLCSPWRDSEFVIVHPALPYPATKLLRSCGTWMFFKFDKASGPSEIRSHNSDLSDKAKGICLSLPTDDARHARR